MADRKPRAGNELTWELDRLLPAALEEASVAKVVDDFLLFLHGLTKLEHETVLSVLPGRPAFESLPVTLDYTSAGVTTPRQNFSDIICYNTVIIYLRHVAPYELMAHLLLRLHMRPGRGLRNLTARMSYLVRDGLFAELIRLDEDDSDRYGIVDEFEATLHEMFFDVRPGFVDFALAELMAQLETRVPKPAELVKVRFEAFILRLIQDKRRADPQRLPQMHTAAEVRFVVEEAHRELFVYANGSHANARDLLYDVYRWYERSAVRQKISGRPIFMEVSHFFGELISTARKLKAGWTFEPHWRTYVVPFLTSEQFWHNVAGLNKDIPYEHTEAARREAAYRRGALIGPLILAAPIILPVVVMVAVRVPGAVIRFGRWAGGQLLLATQYVAATYRVYGAIGGAAAVARDAYVLYLRYPVVVNEVVVAGAEVILDLTGSGTGMAPGSSPADLSAAAARRVATAAKAGVADLAVELKTVGRRSEAEVEFVEFVAATGDGKTHRVVAEVKGFDNGKVKTTVKEVTTVVGDYGSAKKLVFYSSPSGAAGAAPDVRAAAAAVDVLPPTRVAPASRGSILVSPRNTRIAGKQVKSWHPEVLLGTGQDQMRRAALAIIKANPDHPLAKSLVKGRFLTGGSKETWEADARFLQAAHVRSKKEGGADIIVLMSAHHNQRFAADLERAGTPGAVLLDEVFDIGGIAMHKQTARDLVKQGWLEPSVLDDAKTIDLRNLDFAPASAPGTAKALAGARATDPASRMTGRAAGQVKVAAAPAEGGLLAAPANTRIAGKQVKSWHPEVLVGTSQDQMRSAALRIITAKSDHPLARALVNGRFRAGDTMAEWEKDARYLQAAHVRSKKAGGEDVIVLMSTQHNQRMSADLERAGTPGVIALDEVFAIGGIAVHKQTAHDLVTQGWLDKAVVDNARTIDLRHLEI